MLSTPPAFVLSQNQTLRWKNRKAWYSDLKQRITHGGAWLKLTKFETIWWLSNINKYLVLVSVSITIMVILLNKAHYWVLKQHTDSTPQLTLSRSLTVERSFMLFSLLPRSRGNSINYTSVLFAVQIRFPWFTPQCFFPKLFHHHQQAIWEFSKQETKTLYNWKSFNRFWLGETPKKTLRFFLLAAATHTTIQMPKWVCNPKMGEVEHK